MTNREIKLLPCPFCGSNPVWLPADRLAAKERHIACVGEECFGPSTTATDEDAVVQWNSRVVPAFRRVNRPAVIFAIGTQWNEIAKRHRFPPLRESEVEELADAAITGSVTMHHVTESERTHPASTHGAQPVAWTIPGNDTADANGFITACIHEGGEFTRPLYASPQPQVTEELKTLSEKWRREAKDLAQSMHESTVRLGIEISKDADAADRIIARLTGTPHD